MVAGELSNLEEKAAVRLLIILAAVPVSTISSVRKFDVVPMVAIALKAEAMTESDIPFAVGLLHKGFHAYADQLVALFAFFAHFANEKPAFDWCAATCFDSEVRHTQSV